MAQLSSQSNSIHCDVLIVGAGLSGLYSAALLSAAGINVKIIEAQQRIGGRILTEYPEDVSFIDLGAQYIRSGQNRLMKLIKEFGIRTFPTYEEGLDVDWSRGRRLTFRGLVPPEEIGCEGEIFRLAALLTEMANTISLEAPWEASQAIEWDRRNFLRWLDENSDSERAKSTIIRSLEKSYSANIELLSILGALFCFRSGEILKSFSSQEMGDSELSFDGGAGQLIEKIAKTLSDNLILGSQVYEIKYSQDKVVARTHQNTISAYRAIITIPPAIASRIHYEPRLSLLRDHLTQRTPMDFAIKAHVIYAEPFWRHQGLSGTVNSDYGVVRFCKDSTPPSEKIGVLLAVIEGRGTAKLAGAEFEERRSAVIADLIRYFGEEAADFINYYEKSWGDDEFSRGSYGGYFSPGVWSEYGVALRTPVGPIHWAGAETSPIWNGKMEGALLSAERAAEEVIHSLQKVF